MAGQSARGAGRMDEFEHLHRQLAELQSQNEVLKLEREISDLKYELSRTMQLQTSTPKLGKPGQTFKPHRRLPSTPFDRSEISFNAADPLADQSCSDDRPDRFVTKRRYETSSDVKS